MQTSLHIFERVRVATPQSSASCEATMLVSRNARRSAVKPNSAELASKSIEPRFYSSRFVSLQFAISCFSSPRFVLSRFTSLRFASSRFVSLQFVFATVCAVAAVLSGCAANQKPRARAFPWTAAKNVRPLAPEKTSSDVSNEDLFADLGLAVPAPPSPMAAAPSGPHRPHVAVVSTEMPVLRTLRKRR